MRVPVAIWSKSKIVQGQPDQCVWGLGNADNFSEWHLCQNLTDSSIYLPLVVSQSALGHLGFWGTSAEMWLLAGAGQSTACAAYLPAVCVSKLPIWLPLRGVRTQGKCKSHSIQFPHPQPSTIFT